MAVCALLCREDAGERLDIPVPPEYDQDDFRTTTRWKHRGQLDVPKERFVSSPGADGADGRGCACGCGGNGRLPPVG